MRIRVLGTLEIQRGTHRQRISAGKQRALLATLTANAGRTVSIDRMVDELWPDGAVGTAVNQVHGYVWRLRTALDDADGQLIRTHAPGYELAVGTDDLDALRFGAVAGLGTHALRSGDVERAHRLLTKALALWRGPAYGDVPATPSIRAEADRLDAYRMSVLESRIDADLALGRHAGLVAELQTLVDAEPFHERLWEQLMLALCWSGRQTEALAAYRQLYQRLDEQLGVKPNRAVQALHQQILENSPDLDPPRAGSTVAVVLRRARTGQQSHAQVRDPGQSVARTHRSLIPAPTAELTGWRHRTRSRTESVDGMTSADEGQVRTSAPSPRSAPVERAEFDALRKEVLHLREELRILKRATPFFVEATR